MIAINTVIHNKFKNDFLLKSIWTIILTDFNDCGHFVFVLKMYLFFLALCQTMFYMLLS